MFYIQISHLPHQCGQNIMFESGVLKVQDLPGAVIFTSFGVFPKEKA